eukprot:759327-Hanusia_phi.AAC.9
MSKRRISERQEEDEEGSNGNASNGVPHRPTKRHVMLDRTKSDEEINFADAGPQEEVPDLQPAPRLIGEESKRREERPSCHRLSPHDSMPRCICHDPNMSSERPFLAQTFDDIPKECDEHSSWSCTSSRNVRPEVSQEEFVNHESLPSDQPVRLRRRRRSGAGSSRAPRNRLRASHQPIYTTNLLEDITGDAWEDDLWLQESLRLTNGPIGAWLDNMMLFLVLLLFAFICKFLISFLSFVCLYYRLILANKSLTKSVDAKNRIWSGVQALMNIFCILVILVVANQENEVGKQLGLSKLTLSRNISKVDLIKYLLFEPISQESNFAEMMSMISDLHAPVKLICGHIFCDDCVMQWLERSLIDGTCPLCRQVVQPAAYVYISMKSGEVGLLPQLF